MIVSIANNIISPLGMSTTENYAAVKVGQSKLQRYEGRWGLPEPFVASLIDREGVEQAFAALADNAKYTFFEKMLILSASKAIAEAGIDTSSDRVLFVLSTTKGNVFLLDKRETGFPKERVLLGVAARQITDFFHNPNTPIVISNACISGVCAQIEALRNLESGTFDYVVVMGCDVQSAFIVSGFQSFKALSAEPCKPFDANRCGLNLGDAAATIVYTRKETAAPEEWVACRGAIRNDANHISGPSRTGEGSYRALKAVLGDMDPERIAFINAHGTATLYNDEMESVAIERAGLAHVPVNGLKGYYGHTMGAAGVLETILSMKAIDDRNILATRGYETMGVTHPLVVSNQNQATEKRAFIKLLSGFGGCNAALLMAKGGELC
ncbi:MAG: beta-ketoacyl synthase [Bacteroidales bacterium]|nr:beta-ketoacyl synthase [Bacteroidales bacterium]